MASESQSPTRRAVLAASCVALAGGAELARAEPVLYSDKLGRTVRIQAPVKRAVAYQLYEFFGALKCWDQIAGVGEYVLETELFLACKPAAAARLATVGGISNINIEAMLRLKPDVVLTWSSSPERVRFMEQHGLPVIAVYPDTVAETYSVLGMLGRIFGRESETRHTAQQMDRIFDVVRARATRVSPRSPRKVLWIFERPTSVAGGSGLSNSLITIAGAANAAASVGERYANVSMEMIVGWNPDVVLIYGHAKYTPRDIVSNPQWRFVKAAREGRVYQAPRWQTWSPRLAPLALWAVSKIYPEYFRDVDIPAVTDRFYRSVFGIPILQSDGNAF